MKKILGVSALACLLSLNASSVATINNNIDLKRASSFVKLETTLNSASFPETNVVSPVYINTQIESLVDLMNVSEAEVRPANVIFYVNEDMELCSSSMKSFSIDFMTAYNDYMKGKFLPVLYVANDSIKTAVINYLNDVFCPLDFAICSSDYNILKEIRTQGNGAKIRSILDCSSLKLGEKTNVEILKEVNKSRSNTVILSDELATKENIEYFNARLKTTWVNNKNYSDLNTVKLITDGIYGIITPEYQKAIDCFDYFSKSPNASRNINRYSFNIAHRGLCYDMPENSLEGYKTAFEKGATHIETDVHLSQDGKIVVMHDATLDRTTNGTGTIAQMTSEQISQYKITKNYSGTVVDKEGVKIPLLEDLFNEFKGNGKVLVVEIKDANENLVPEFKKLLDQYDMYDQVVCISFYEKQLQKMRDLIPEVPCSTLNNYKSSMFNKITSDGIVTFNQGAFGIDLNASLFSKQYDYDLATRGFSGYYWTFDQKSNMYTAMHNGIVGMTNNRASLLEDHAIKLLTPEDPITVTTSNYLDFEYEIDYINYKGTIGSKKLTAIPIIAEEHGTYADVIFAAEYKLTKTTPAYRGVFFSDVVKVYKDKDSITPTPDPDENPDSGFNSSLFTIIFCSIIGVIVAGIFGFLIYKQFKKK